MPFHTSEIPGLLIFEPKVFEDSRGYLFESYNARTFAEAGIEVAFVQDNQSRSSCHVVRGLHFQRPPFAQAKLIRVIRGEILDVALDIRRGSPTYGHHVKLVLSEGNRKQFFIPRGFAHGFLILSEIAEIAYKCDNYYSPEHDAGIAWDDPDLAIDWGISSGKAILSPKDQSLPAFRELNSPFTQALA